MTPAAVLSILVQTQGVGSAVADLTKVDRAGKSAGAGLDKTGASSAKTGGLLKTLGGTAKLAAGAAGVGGLFAAVGEMTSEYRDAQKTAAQTNAVLKSTGGAAGISAAGVGRLAEAISRKTGIDDEQIQASENMLLTFTNVQNKLGAGNDIFDRATKTITDMSVALGQSGKSSAIQLGKALNDPIKGVTALQRVGVTFTEQQKDQIKQMVKSGDALGAQKLILKELNKEFGGSAAAQATAGEKLRTSFANLAEAGGRILVPMLDKVAGVVTALFDQMLEGRGIGGALVAGFAAVADAAAAMGKVLGDVFGWFKRHEDATVALGAAVGTFFAILAGYKIFNAVRAAWIALNASFIASPIGLIALALAGLVAALVLAYKHSEAFRKIIDTAFAALRGAAGAVASFLGSFADLPGKLLEVGRAITTGIVDGVKSLPGALLDAAGWVKDRVIDGIKLYLTPYRAVGGWIIGRLVDGTKALAGVVIAVGGWLKNRIVDGVQAYLGAYKTVGGWLLNRIVDGVKTVGGLLASVGGWLKNRIVDFIQAEAAGFKVIGGWIVNRLVDGIKVVTDALSSVGGWFKNRIVDTFESAKDGFLTIGKSVIGWIVQGLKDGANAIPTFLNKIGDVIEKFVPGDFKFPTVGPIFKAGGGWVGTPGQAGRDTVPAMLGRGEAVLNRHQQKPVNAALMSTYGYDLGGLFNRVRTPHYLAGGGIVGGAVAKASSVAGDVLDVGKKVVTAPLGLLEKGAGFVLDKLPGLGDLPDWIKGMGALVKDKIGDWIKSKVGDLFGGGSAPEGQTGGVVPFDGKPIAAWIAPILAAARRDGVAFSVSSGFRSFAEQTYLWNKLGRDPEIVARPGTSNHEGSAYPRGAVDISPGWAALSAWLARHPNLPLHHYGSPRDPYHFSASGHARGGFVTLARGGDGASIMDMAARVLPRFEQGGVANGWAVVGEKGPELAKLPGGTRVYSNAQSQRISGGETKVVTEIHFHGPAVLDAQFEKYLQDLNAKSMRRNGRPLLEAR